MRATVVEIPEQPDSTAMPEQWELAWRPTVEEVVQAVCKESGIHLSELMARRPRGNDGRLAAIYWCRAPKSGAAKIELASGS